MDACVQFKQWNDIWPNRKRDIVSGHQRYKSSLTMEKWISNRAGSEKKLGRALAGRNGRRRKTDSSHTRHFSNNYYPFPSGEKRKRNVFYAPARSYTHTYVHSWLSCKSCSTGAFFLVSSISLSLSLSVSFYLLSLSDEERSRENARQNEPARKKGRMIKGPRWKEGCATSHRNRKRKKERERERVRDEMCNERGREIRWKKKTGCNPLCGNGPFSFVGTKQRVSYPTRK